jgi:hypothetical protein
MIPEKSYKPQGLKVALRNNNGSISLRYSYQGKQIDLSLGLSWDSVPCHQKATSIANQIHNDIYISDVTHWSHKKSKIRT